MKMQIFLCDKSHLVTWSIYCPCLFSREVSGRSLWMKNAPAKCFYAAFLSFTFHTKPVLASSTISYSFGCQDSPVKDFGGPSTSIKMVGSHTVTFASIHMLRNLMTQWWMDVKEKRIFSPDKIFTASKPSRRNLWSFVVLVKILVGAKNRSH